MSDFCPNMRVELFESLQEYCGKVFECYELVCDAINHRTLVMGEEVRKSYESSQLYALLIAFVMLLVVLAMYRVWRLQPSVND